MRSILKKEMVVFALVYLVMVVFNLVYALPSFAIVELNNKYKTEESSIKTNAPVFNFTSGAQVLMEASTGRIIYANNENDRLYPASVTKVMTMLLIMEKIDSGALKYTDIVTCSKQASLMGGSQIWFKEGETLTVDEALKCIAVVSANDVSFAMAELIGGSHENFVNMMNNKAKELGMENTNFMNAHGIDEEGHYTSAKDIAIMSRELINKHPDILKYTSIWQDNIRNGSFTLSSTNKLLKTYNGLTGLKTGSTSTAMFNLSATATREGLTFIAVVMKGISSAERNEEITTLLNYGFANYSVEKLCTKNDVIAKIKVNKSLDKEYNVIPDLDKSILKTKGETLEFRKVVEISKNITAPITKGSVVGNIKWLDKNNEILSETNLIIDEKIGRSNFGEYVKKIIEKYVFL